MGVIIYPEGQRAVEVTRDRPVMTVVQSNPQVLVQAGGLQGPPGAQGVPGPSGDGVTTKEAAQALGGHRIVRTTSGTQVNYASASIEAHGDDVLGMTYAAVGAGDEVAVITDDEITEPSWNWTPLEPLYLGENGLMTQTPPTAEEGAAFTLVVGFATSATTARIRVETPIYF